MRGKITAAFAMTARDAIGRSKRTTLLMRQPPDIPGGFFSRFGRRRLARQDAEDKGEPAHRSPLPGDGAGPENMEAGVPEERT